MERSVIQIHNSKTIFPKKIYSNTSHKYLDIKNGARIVFTMYVFSLDAGTTVEAKIKTSFSEKMPFYEVLNLTSTSVKHVKGVLSDFHNFINVDLIVTGGTAEVILGINVYDNALTTRIDNAEISVDLNAEVQPNGEYDSVRIGDGTDELEVNDDGSINVNIVNTQVIPEIIQTPYYNISNVPKNTSTLIGTYIAPNNKQSFLQKVNVSGNNFAEYILKINGSDMMKKRTSAASSLNVEFDLTSSERGKELQVGDQLQVYVSHVRPFDGDFETTYQVLEIG